MDQDEQGLATAAEQQMAQLTLLDGAIELPIVVGTEGERAIDIRSLRRETGYITLEPGSSNTVSKRLTSHALLHEGLLHHFEGFPNDGQRGARQAGPAARHRP